MERRESTMMLDKGRMLVDSRDHMAMGRNCKPFFPNFFHWEFYERSELFENRMKNEKNVGKWLLRWKKFLIGKNLIFEQFMDDIKKF